MYSVSAHGQMIADRVRMDAYAQALRQAIQPGATVLDIGTGTGILALLACQAGAGHVYAIEADDVIQLAREAADANGFADRITFIQGLSTEVSLPRPADVIVSDIRGVLPLFERHIPAIADARRRLLAPGGILIPQHDRLWVAPVNAPETYARLIEAWDTNACGFDMGAAKRAALNSWTKARVKPEQRLGEAKLLAAFDYTCIEDSDVRSSLSWTAVQEGLFHGLCVWFDTELLTNIGFSNAPDSPGLIYGSAFFPLEQVVTFSPGDRLSIELRANLVGDDYLWQWSTRVLENGSEGRAKADFRQSTFYGVPLSPDSLRKRSPSYTPTLNTEGQTLHFVLSQMASGATLSIIAEQLLQEFPDNFRDLNEALSFAGELAKRYG